MQIDAASRAQPDLIEDLGRCATADDYDLAMDQIRDDVPMTGNCSTFASIAER